MTQYIITNGSEYQCVKDLAGCDGWSVVTSIEGDLPEFHEIVGNEVVADLPAFKAIKRAAVTALRDTRQEGQCPTPVGLVQCDEKSKLKINGLVSMATIAKSAGQPFSVNFTLADNSVVTLDADGMIMLGVAVGQYVMACHDHASALKQTVAAATTIAELDAIDLEAGWP